MFTGPDEAGACTGYGVVVLQQREAASPWQLCFSKHLVYLSVFGSSLLHGLLSSCCEQGLASSCGVRASHGGGCCFCRPRARGCVGFSSRGSQALEHSVGHRGTRA